MSSLIPPWFGDTPTGPDPLAASAANAGAAAGEAAKSAAAAVTSAVNPGSWLMSTLGISPARLSKGVHQVLVSALGSALILLGFVMVVMNTNSGKAAGRAIVEGGKKAAKAAAETAAVA